MPKSPPLAAREGSSRRCATEYSSAPAATRTPSTSRRRLDDEKDCDKTNFSVVGGRGSLTRPIARRLAAGGRTARTVAPYGVVVESGNVSVLLYVRPRRASVAPLACFKAR